jgi:hypothetical protein
MGRLAREKERARKAEVKAKAKAKVAKVAKVAKAKTKTREAREVTGPYFAMVLLFSRRTADTAHQAMFQSMGYNG